MNLYYNLFNNYSDKQFRHSVELQKERFVRWGLDMKGKTVLDIGCGGGRTLVAIRELGGKPIGLEIDENLAWIAQKRTGEKVWTASALDIPKPKETFDVVICSSVAHHTPDPQKAIDEAYRVLKKGGKVYFGLYIPSFKRSVDLFMRKICKYIPFEVMFKLPMPANKKYAWLDNWYTKDMWIFSTAHWISMMKEFKSVSVIKDKPVRF